MALPSWVYRLSWLMQLSCGVVPLSGTGGGSAFGASAGASCARPAAAKPMAIATVNASNLDVDVNLMDSPPIGRRGVRAVGRAAGDNVHELPRNAFLRRFAP